MTSPLIRNFQSLAKYNALANTRLYDACAGLSDGERKLDRKAFFVSIHNTLNHILVADRIWMSRFEGSKKTNYDLSEVIYDNFLGLRAARSEEDERIQIFTDTMSEAFAAGTMTWTNSAGNTRSEVQSLLVTHMFNHQTHHRGQVHNMLSQAGVKTPVLDLPWVLR
jgi:uncharacterized damage-inducible protein DinB